jgi:MFS family permease
MNRVRTFLSSYHPIVHSLLLGTILARAASTMSLPFLALYLSKHTSMSAVMIGVVIGMGALAGTLGGFIGGALSDRFGRRVIMLAALVGWVVVFFGFSFVQLPVFFMLLNMMNGLCRSFYEPVSQALMADLTEPAKRFKVFSHRYMAINIGAAVGPLMGGYLAEFSGSMPFVITGLVYSFYTICLYVMLNKFGIKQIEGEKKTPITMASAWNIIRGDRIFRFYIAGGIIGGIGYSQMTVTLSQYMANGLTNGVKLFAILMSVNAIAVILLQIPLVRLAEKRSPLVAIIIGNIMFTLGDVGFAMSHAPIGFIISMVIFTLGEILNYPSANLLIDKLAPPHMRGSYYGAQTFTNLGHFIGPWVGGFLLSFYGGKTLFLVMGAVALFGSYFYWGGSRRAMKQSSTSIHP